MYFDIDSISLQCRCCWRWSDPNSCLTTNLRPSPSLDSTTVLWLAVWLCSATTVPHHSELNYWKEDSSLIQKKSKNCLYPTWANKSPTKICWKYSNVPNRRSCMFISGKVCLLSSNNVKRQTLPEINVHARLFGTLEYEICHLGCLGSNK